MVARRWIVLPCSDFRGSWWAFLAELLAGRPLTQYNRNQSHTSSHLSVRRRAEESRCRIKTVVHRCDVASNKRIVLYFLPRTKHNESITPTTSRAFRTPQDDEFQCRWFQLSAARPPKLQKARQISFIAIIIWVLFTVYEYVRAAGPDAPVG